MMKKRGVFVRADAQAGAEQAFKIKKRRNQMAFENIEFVLSLLGTSLGLLAAALAFLLKFIGSAKAKKAAEREIKMTNALIPAIEAAEDFLHYSGTEKKEYVLTKAAQFAFENKIKFIPEAVSGKIEELIVLSKKVNARRTERQPQPFILGR